MSSVVALFIAIAALILAIRALNKARQVEIENHQFMDGDDE